MAGPYNIDAVQIMAECLATQLIFLKRKFSASDASTLIVIYTSKQNSEEIIESFRVTGVHCPSLYPANHVSFVAIGGIREFFSRCMHGRNL
jgi:hypothetical protein